MRVVHQPIAAVLFALAVTCATSAIAQSSIYTCRDHTGKTISSDHPLTDADDRAKRMADETAREKHRRDVALLTAYQSEDQIEEARRRALADASESIKFSQTRLADLDKEKKSLAQEGDGYKGKIPPLFQRKLDDNQALIDDEQATIRMRQTDVERINQRYDEEKKRFRELSTSPKTR